MAQQVSAVTRQLPSDGSGARPPSSGSSATAVTSP